MEHITFELRDGIGLLTLNRPTVLNSLNVPLMDEVRATVANVRADKDVRALVLTGAGRGFCAGADLTTTGAPTAGMSAGQAVAHSMDIAFNPMVRDIADLPIPTIAAVNGIAAGGGVGLALVCDIVVAAKSSAFVSVFAPRLGLIPDMGCTWLLPRLLGRARARAMAITGEKVSAATAAEWGMIWKCVEDGELMGEVMSIAGKIAKGPSNAFGEVKKALDIAEKNSLSDQLDYERDIQGVLGDHPNFTEGVMAFATKREPSFS